MLHLLILSILLSPSQAQSLNYSAHYEWNYINYTWSSANSSLSYIPEHNVITGIKVWKDQVYLSLPRFYTGVPVSLAVVPKWTETPAPLLQPYPSWEMQREDDCKALTYVQSFEIDTEGRMWVISNGRVELLTKQPRLLCPSRLVILDLEDNGKVLLDYAFPDDVVHPSTVFLNDIVVDYEGGGFAYISDNDSEYPGIIVFSLQQRRSWKVTHSSMDIDKEAVQMIINGTKFDSRSPVNGIALSQASLKGNKLLYYCPMSSFELFSVPTWVLKNRVENIGPYVVTVGKKESQSSGMLMSSAGLLYFNELTLDGVASWDTLQPPFARNHQLLIQDHTRSQYPDSLAIDETGGKLWYTSNRLQAFRTGTVNLTEPNLRVIVTEMIDAKSYLYYKDGSKPKAPMI